MGTKERKHTAPPRYDEAFKAGAVRMVTEQGRPSREVAEELGICIDTLRSWLKAAGAPSLGQTDRQNRDAKRLIILPTNLISHYVVCPSSRNWNKATMLTAIKPYFQSIY